MANNDKEIKNVNSKDRNLIKCLYYGIIRSISCKVS